MTFEERFFSPEGRYSLGVETESGQPFASFPVTNGLLDYEEYYELSPEQYDRFMADRTAALSFVEEARRREHDELLMEKPGWNRGIPY